MVAYDPFLNREWATQQAVFPHSFDAGDEAIVRREILDLMKRGAGTGQREAVCGRLGAGMTWALIRNLKSPIVP